MRNKVKFSNILLIIALSVVVVFAQAGDNANNNAKAEENTQTAPNKKHESLSLQYEISPVPMKYLFTSKTEVNAKIENLNDETKNKDIISTLNSSTTLKLTSEELTTDNYKLKIAIEKLSGAYDIDGKQAEFSITKDGMKTKVDGEEGANIPELSDWRKDSPDSIGKNIAEFTLTKEGKIKNAVSLTSSGSQAGNNTYLGGSGFDKSLIYLQNPLVLMNLLFWELPSDKLEFDRVGNIPVKPAPSWKSKINYPFKSAFEFENVDSDCTVVSVVTEKPAETEDKDKDAEETEKKPIQKTIRIQRTIKHPTEKDTQIVAYLDYDVVKRVPTLVTFDIYRKTELNPTDDRKITIVQKTNYRFVLQK